MSEKEVAAQSDAWSQLFVIMEPYQISRATFDDMVRFASVPEDLTSFGIVVSNLISIFKRSIDILKIQSSEEQEFITNIESWITCCEAIATKGREIEQHIPGFNLKAGHSYHPSKRGYYKSHPLGVALYSRVLDPKLIAQYHLLQAYLCLAHHYVRNLEASKGYSYGNAKSEACLAVRNLTKSHLAIILHGLPSTPLTIQDYRDALKSWDYNLEIRRIRALLTHAITGRKGIIHTERASRKHSLQSEEHPFNDYEQVNSYAENDDVHHAAKLKTLNAPSISESQLNQQERELCCREEFSSPRDTYLFEHEGPDPSGGFSWSQYRLMARGFAAAAAMQNQRLISDWDRLTPYEVQSFLAYLDELSGLEGKQVGGVPATELAAFISICFWISATPEVACECTLVPAAARCTAQLGIFPDSKNEWNWVVKPVVPVQSLVPEQVLSTQAVQLASRYTIPLPEPCVKTMGRHLATFRKGVKVVNVFRPELLDKYMTAATFFLERVRQLSNGRQTFRRISAHLHELIARTPGADITTAIAITGRNDPLGAVPLHYTVNAVASLEKYYQVACNEICDDAAIEKKPEGAVTESRRKSVHVGSRYVPRVKTVRQLSDNLRDRLNKARTACEQGEPQMIALHNAMIVYTAQMIGFATGYRNVRDPLLQDAEIDRVTNFAVISDKDDDSFYNSRIIWLPDCCIKQLDYYREHLELLQEWLFFYDPELFFQTRENAVSGRHAERHNPALFVLWPDGNVNPLQPSVMKNLVSDVGYDLPGNANRHYLRSSLLAMNCPVEIINAFMGHWSRGMEPWGRYSGLSPIDYREELSPYLVQLLRDDGWKETRGLRRLP